MRPGQSLDGRIKTSSISHFRTLRNNGEQRCVGLRLKFTSRGLSTSRERMFTVALNRTYLNGVLHQSVQSSDMGKGQTHGHTGLSSSTEAGWGGGHLCFYNEYNLEIRFN